MFPDIYIFAAFIPGAGSIVVRIAEIEAGSIADDLHLEIGTRVIRINGQRVRDGIDLTFLLAEGQLELETVSPSGEEIVYDIEREPGESVGIVPAPDAIRECANKCVFCFIDGNPAGVRETLWLRDDDFRLSFTYGSYVTLTNLGPKGLQRLVDQRISPLYVSVHATEPAVRVRLLVNERAGMIMNQLGHLLASGIEVHTQIVVCPEWNDGYHLGRTIDDLYSLGEGVLSLSVVPVGLTRYNLDNPVRRLTADEAGQAIDQVDRARRRAMDERGLGWAYSADEMYLIAGRPFPDNAYYEPWSLTENGVGAVNRFVADFEAGVDTLPDLAGRRILILTGASMEPFFSERVPRIEASTGATVAVKGVANRFFGESVTIAGLLGGNDLIEAAAGEPDGDVILIPGEALNADGLFIDSVSLDDMEARVAPSRVIAGHDLTECLQAL